MLIELNRFFTTDEVRREYRIPDALAPKILPDLPFVLEQEDGTRTYLESEVDDSMGELVRRERKAKARKGPAPQGRPGRKVETFEIAAFANELRRQGKIWKEVLSACKERWPDDNRVRHLDQVRATWRRYFGPGKKSN